MFDSARLGRRQLLHATAAGGAFALLPGAARAVLAAGDPFATLLAQLADEYLLLAPESATSLGLDTGSRASLKGQLGDSSQAGIDKMNALIRSMHARLLRVDRAKLTPVNRLRLDTVRYATERGLDGTGFRYGGGGGAGFVGGTTPYVVSQQNGAVTGVPEFLVSQHNIANKVDAEAYLARVAAFARQIDEETDQVRAHAAIGVMPPRFIAQNALGILKSFRGTPAVQQRLVVHLGERAEGAGVGGRLCRPRRRDYRDRGLSRPRSADLHLCHRNCQCADDGGRPPSC